jgi:hypothetical protein
LLASLHQEFTPAREQYTMTFIQAMFRAIERSKLKMGAVEMTGFAAIIASIIITLAAVSFIPTALLGKDNGSSPIGSTFVERQ